MVRFVCSLEVGYTNWELQIMLRYCGRIPVVIIICQECGKGFSLIYPLFLLFIMLSHFHASLDEETTLLSLFRDLAFPENLSLHIHPENFPDIDTSTTWNGSSDKFGIETVNYDDGVCLLFKSR